MRAGLSLPEALSQLGSRGPESLRPSFAAFAEDYRATGRFQDCLDSLKDRLADPVADRVIESLRIAHEVGGSDLGRLTRTPSAFLRQEARTRSELQSRQGWMVNAARLAVAAPWIVLTLLTTRPEAIAAYDRPWDRPPAPRSRPRRALKATVFFCGVRRGRHRLSSLKAEIDLSAPCPVWAGG